MTSGPAESLRVGFNDIQANAEDEFAASRVSSWGPEPSVYVCYGDVMFTEVGLKKLVSADSQNAILVDQGKRLQKHGEIPGGLDSLELVVRAFLRGK